MTGSVDGSVISSENTTVRQSRAGASRGHLDNNQEYSRGHQDIEGGRGSKRAVAREWMSPFFSRLSFNRRFFRNTNINSIV